MEDILSTLTIGNGSRSISLGPNQTALLEAGPFPLAVTFVIFVAHSLSEEISLSDARDSSQYITGRHVGFVSELHGKQAKSSCLLRNLNEISSANARISLQVHGEVDPIPGGCAMQFPIPDAPVMLQYPNSSSAFIVSISLPVANAGFSRKQGEHPCYDETIKTDLEYIMYGSLTTDKNKDARLKQLSDMSTATGVLKHGRRMCSLNNRLPLRFDIATWEERGVIYAVLVRNQSNPASGQSAYVPLLINGCDPDGECATARRSTVATVVATIGGIVGFILCASAHRFLGLEQFIIGFYLGTIVMYILVYRYTTLTEWGIVVIAACMGLLVGFLLYSIWWFVSIEFLQLIVVTFLAGFIVSCFLSYYFFDSWYLLNMNMSNYIAAFVISLLSFVLLCFLFLLLRHVKVEKMLNIACSSFIGSFAIVLAIGVYMNAPLKYVFVRSIQRFAIPELGSACFLYIPLSSEDVVLLVVWACVWLLGIIWQTSWTRGKPLYHPTSFKYFPKSGLWGLIVGRFKQAEPLPPRRRYGATVTAQVQPTVSNAAEDATSRTAVIS